MAKIGYLFVYLISWVSRRKMKQIALGWNYGSDIFHYNVNADD